MPLHFGVWCVLDRFQPEFLKLRVPVVISVTGFGLGVFRQDDFLSVAVASRWLLDRAMCCLPGWEQGVLGSDPGDVDAAVW